MKKTYINPVIREISEETEEMIATSLGIGDPVDSAAGADSRQASLWDDED